MRATKRATYGRHQEAEGLPIFRIMTVMMLASLLSTLFALPATAAPGVVDVGVAISSVPANGANVKVGTAVVYTITVTNTDTNPSPVGVVATDNIGTGAYVSDDATCTNATPVFTCTDGAAIPGGGTWVFHITVNAPGVAGSLVNSVSVVEAGDTDGSNNSDSNTTNTVATLADVTIVKSHAAGTLTPGSPVTYSLQVNNAGPDTATGTVLHDSLNPSLTFTSSASGCTAAAPPVVSCPVPDVTSGGNQTVTFVATIGVGVPASTVITNTASVFSTVTPQSDTTNDTSNVDSLTVGAASVDLGLTLTVLPTTAAPGDTVTYTATVTNPDTTTDATNVVVTDALPTGLTAVTPPTTTTTGTAAAASNTWTWTIPTLTKATAVGTPDVATATFDATVDATATLGTLTNTATVTATQTDPVSTNNTASADLTVQASSADVSVTLGSNDPNPQSGDTVKVTLQISNAGPADATNVVVQDTYSSGLKYVGCSGCSSGSASSGLRLVASGQRSAQKKASSQLFGAALVKSGFSATATLTFKITATQGTVTNKASVLSMDQSDPAASNDKDNLSLKISFSNNSGSGSGGTGSGTSGSGGTSGTGGTAFTGFTAGQLIPWFMLFGSLGLVALEYSRRRALIAPVGHTWGFEPWQ